MQKFSDMLNGPFPADITLGVIRGWIQHDPKWSFIQRKKMRVRFLYTLNRREIPDNLTLGQYRRLCAKGLAKVEIDGPDGDLPALLPELVF